MIQIERINVAKKKNLELNGPTAEFYETYK